MIPLMQKRIKLSRNATLVCRPFTHSLLHEERLAGAHPTACGWQGGDRGGNPAHQEIPEQRRIAVDGASQWHGEEAWGKRSRFAERCVNWTKRQAPPPRPTRPPSAIARTTTRQTYYCNLVPRSVPRTRAPKSKAGTRKTKADRSGIPCSSSLFRFRPPDRKLFKSQHW